MNDFKNFLDAIDIAKYGDVSNKLIALGKENTSECQELALASVFDIRMQVNNYIHENKIDGFIISSILTKKDMSKASLIMEALKVSQSLMIISDQLDTRLLRILNKKGE